MLESFFYSVNSESINRDIFNLLYLYYAEIIIWTIIFSIIFPYGFSIRFGKFIGWIGIFLLLFITLFIGNRQLGTINTSTSIKVNIELITMVFGFLNTQIGFLTSGKTLFKKNIKKKHIKWFDKKE